MIIGVVSAKEGVGKTMTVANLASALIELGFKVCIVDCNKTISNLGLHLGIEEYPLTMNDVLKGKVKIIDAVFVHPDHNIHLISSSVSLADVRTLGTKTLKDIMKKLEKIYDFIILDTIPGFQEKALDIIKSCDKVILVTTPELSEFADSKKFVNLLKKNKVKIFGIVLNRILGKDFEVKTEDVRSLCKINVLTTIREDMDVPESISSKTPIVILKPKSAVSQSFMVLAKNLSHESKR